MMVATAVTMMVMVASVVAVAAPALRKVKEPHRAEAPVEAGAVVGVYVEEVGVEAEEVGVEAEEAGVEANEGGVEAEVEEQGEAGEGARLGKTNQFTTGQKPHQVSQYGMGYTYM